MTAEQKQRLIRIGERLKELRKEANYKTIYIAKYLGINPRTYLRYECDTEYSGDFGCNLGMPLRSLIRLARLHKCSTDYILCLSDERGVTR